MSARHDVHRFGIAQGRLGWYNYRKMRQLDNGYELGSYRILRPLGAGGMAAVYEVEHVTLGVHYALKTFTLETGRAELFRKRFLAEGRLLARMKHPGLVRVFDLAYDEATGLLYYVMDLVLYKDGQAHTLADVEEGSVEELRAAQWFSELCDALAYVHSLGVVHRDIKLNNILLTPDGHVVLSDFGISRVMGEKLRSDLNVSRTMVVTDGQSTSRLVMGTEGFIAPEILQGYEATPAADVYSLGVVFFKLLTGVWYDPCLAPNSGGQGATSVSSVKLLGHLDYNWSEILPRMLETNPAKRPSDLRDLAASLGAKDPDGQPRPVRPPARKWRRLAIAGAAAAAIAAAVALAFLLRGGKAASPSGYADLDDAFAIPEELR